MTSYIIGAVAGAWNWLVAAERETATEILGEFHKITARLEVARDKATQEAQQIAIQVEKLNAVAVVKATEAELAHAVAEKIRGLVSK